MDATDERPSAWEAVDYSLHRLKHILKGAMCVSEAADPIDETMDTLIALALAHVEATQDHLWELRKQYHKETAPAPRPADEGHHGTL